MTQRRQSGRGSCPALLVAATTTNTMAVDDVRVRQVCVGAWSIIACGTLTGDVIALDLKDYGGNRMMSGSVMGCAMGAH